MNGRWFATAAAVSVLGAMCAACGGGSAEVQARTQAAAVQGVSANANGCPQQNVEKACLTLKGAGGVVYDISNAGVDMSRGKSVTVVGRDKGETSACGKVLSDTAVDYMNLQCSAPQVAEATTTQVADAGTAR